MTIIFKAGEAIFHLKNGGTLTIDRCSTEYTIEGEELTMEWHESYLWAINDITIFDNPTAFVNFDIASLLEDGWVHFTLEEDADEDYKVWDVHYAINCEDKIVYGLGYEEYVKGSVYEFEVREVLSRIVKIKASNQTDAEELLEKLYDNETIVLGAEDFKEYECPRFRLVKSWPDDGTADYDADENNISDDADNQPGTYEICVRDGYLVAETYKIKYAESADDAKIKAVDMFYDDYSIHSSVSNCQIVSFKED